MVVIVLLRDVCMCLYVCMCGRVYVIWRIEGLVLVVNGLRCVFVYVCVCLHVCMRVCVAYLEYSVYGHDCERVIACMRVCVCMCACASACMCVVSSVLKVR